MGVLTFLFFNNFYLGFLHWTTSILPLFYLIFLFPSKHNSFQGSSSAIPLQPEIQYLSYILGIAVVLYCQQGCSCYYHVQHMFRVHFFLSLCCLGLGFLSFDGFLGEKGGKKKENKKKEELTGIPKPLKV